MEEDKGFLSIKDAVKMLDTEAYVLRFYEKELNLDIKRNDKGHRVYTIEDIELFRKIQEMREKGLQLKAIEAIVHDTEGMAKETYEQLSGISLAEVNCDEDSEEVDITDANDMKVRQFSYLLKDVFKEALGEYNTQYRLEMSQEVRKEVENAVAQKMEQVYKEESKKSEVYYKRLDETIREVQKIKKELSEDKQEIENKEKPSFFSRFFRGRSESSQL